MRILGVGAAACAAAVVLCVAGCGGGAAADPEPSSASSASPAAPSVKDAWATASVVFGESCPPKWTDDCSPHLTELVAAADDVRVAMNADPAGGAFFSKAYTFIDRMDTVRDEYHPLDQGHNRDELLGLADELSTWVEAHPTT